MDRREVTVNIESSHGGFVIEGMVPALSASQAIEDNTLVRWWPDTDAELSGFFASGGSQWGPFAITARLSDDDPGDPDGRWEDIVEVSVTAMGEMSLNEVVEGYVASLQVPSGTYRMRLAARGRTEGYERSTSFPDEDEPEDWEALEHFLVEVWPAAATPAVILRQDSRHARELLDPPEPVRPSEHEPGLQAARALVRDLRRQPGSRPIPGDVGDISLDLDLPGTPTTLFNRLRYTFAWPPCRGVSGSGDRVGRPAYYDATLPELEGAYDSVGHIVTTLLELHGPRHLVMAWNWVPEVDASPSRPYPLDQRPRLLTEDSVVTMTITASAAPGDAPRCAVHLQHRGVPTVWRTDLAALWTWHMTIQSER
ncbi:hypothetical protein [Nocardioides sp. Soil805]|uniref:hypothetical protein n=1 Tax=Nocardioides sp. Soil805 TaxID=1736416 RepID=UPI0007032516|nr:hypothetical protein [Nocardioides sp. Soil805]KRF34184.1 hypothetical protein ASG94_15785 [Nocardioides sp. Soil805]